MKTVFSDKTLLKLKEKAIEASKKAYCKYSNLHVGAAILHNDGSISSGCNVENASYGLTICAERVAVFQAVLRENTEFNTIVIYTPTKEPIPPCGACRQVLSEFGNELKIFSFCDSEEFIETNLKTLFPQSEIILPDK
ncbi:MAG: cytidine deaminase [Bacteroidales bacterium]|nr:cytidine deaminase [Bacteroidales bacterium]MBN2819963.1 cytidine deaminase [Bacteroidales bacterium]